MIVSSPTSLSPNFRVELRDLEGPANTSLSLHNATHLQADDREPDGLSSITKEVQGYEECVFDSAAGQLEPSTIERIVAEIEALAQAREAWTAKTECIRAIIATADKAPEPFDAVLCLTQRDGDQLRLVVIALRKALSPTLNWPANSLSLCGLSNQLVRVAYDRMEGRWQAVVGDGAPTLLDPRSSQDIDGRLRFDDCEWACIYSGPLPT